MLVFVCQNNMKLLEMSLTSASSVEGEGNEENRDIPDASSNIVNVSEYEVIAKQKLPKMAYDFYSAGAEDEWTLRHNKIAFSTIRLRPRVLVDVSKVNLRTTILGHEIPMPIMVAPTALHKMAHPDGELATARAAASAGTIMVVSFSASYNVEEVASASAGPKFFQLYVYKDRRIAENLVCRAEKAGYKAIVLTGDTPRLGRRESDIRNRFVLPPYVTMKNLDGFINIQAKMDDSKGSGLEAYAADTMDRSLNWEAIRWLKSITKLPIILKGVLTPEDATIAVQEGVDAIIVSNHGARQLDYAFPTILALEEIVAAVGGRIPVLMDGGVRRGTDVFKALALGADAVLVGRPVIFGLAVDGESGVKKVLKMLREELELTMSLAGCCSVKDITRSQVQMVHDAFVSKL